MVDRSSRTNFVKTVFDILTWYLLSKRGENKLFKYIPEARNIEEAHLFRMMDCSTICDEHFCFFCALDEGDIHKLCSACNIFQRN